jgi:hypothetical protein
MSASVTKVHGPVWYMNPKLHMRNSVDSMNTEDEKKKRTQYVSHVCGMENRFCVKFKPSWKRIL